VKSEVYKYRTRTGDYASNKRVRVSLHLCLVCLASLIWTVPLQAQRLDWEEDLKELKDRSMAARRAGQ
jgi:hypothetical protein